MVRQGKPMGLILQMLSEYLPQTQQWQPIQLFVTYLQKLCISVTANLSPGMCLCAGTSRKGTGKEKCFQLTTRIICFALRQAQETFWKISIPKSEQQQQLTPRTVQSNPAVPSSLPGDFSETPWSAASFEQGQASPASTGNPWDNWMLFCSRKQLHFFLTKNQTHTFLFELFTKKGLAANSRKDVMF